MVRNIGLFLVALVAGIGFLFLASTWTAQLIIGTVALTFGVVFLCMAFAIVLEMLFG